MAIANPPPFISLKQFRHLLLLLLVAATITVYWHLQHHDFISYDDPSYVTNNRTVQQGITIAGLYWAATAMELSNWHPLTWISHMADCHFFGLNPSGHHWTNLLFHILNAVLLYCMLHRFTGKFWKSIIVAALFALHPLNVESVAWVSERKNVFSTFFLMLAMLGYGYYIARPHWMRYALVLLLFALGLMVKPMLVMLPFVLLLFDCWPLRRTRFRFSDMQANPISDELTRSDEHGVFFKRLLIEKIPMVILSLFSAYITLKAASGHAMASIDAVGLASRIENAAVSYVRYIGKMLWPIELSVFYPYVHSWPVIYITGAVLMLVAVTVFVIWKVRTSPYLAIGWFWYLGTLVPVIGLVQVGMQAMADRYMYVPMIGLLIMIVWGAPDVLKKLGSKKMIFAPTIGVILIMCMILTYYQSKLWQNSRLLFQHAISVTSKNFVAHNLLGIALRDGGQLEEAASNFQQAIAINPLYMPAYQNLGVTRALQKRYEEAIAYYLKAIEIDGENELIRFNIGDALLQSGRFGEAESQFRQAIKLHPGSSSFHNSLGVAFIQLERLEDAEKALREALRLDPNHVGAHYNIARVHAHHGKWDEAIVHLSEAIRIQPLFKQAELYLEELLKKGIH